MGDVKINKILTGYTLIYKLMLEAIPYREFRSLMMGSLSANEKNHSIIFHNNHRVGERDFTKFISLKNELFKNHFGYTLHDLFVKWCNRNNISQDNIHAKIVRNEVYNLLNFGRVSFKHSDNSILSFKKLLGKTRDKIRKITDVENSIFYKEDLEKGFNIKLKSTAESYILVLATPFNITCNSNIRLVDGMELNPVILGDKLNYVYNKELAIFIAGINKEYRTDLVIRYLIPVTAFTDGVNVNKFINSPVPRIKDFKGNKIVNYLNKVTDEVNTESLLKTKSIAIREVMFNKTTLTRNMGNNNNLNKSKLKSVNWVCKMTINTLLVNYKNKLKRIVLKNKIRNSDGGYRNTSGINSSTSHKAI